MLDTTTWTTFRRLLPEINKAINDEDLAGLPSGWHFSEAKTSRPRSFCSKRKIILDHEPSGLHAHGEPGRIEGWSASLPHVLHGYNGIQLKDDAEIAASCARVHTLLDEISQPPEVAETLRRLDVAMNLTFSNPEAILGAFRQNRHPCIRREKECYATGNIRFPGTEVVFTAYWKRPPIRNGAKQKRWHTPRALRLEVQLKKVSKIAEFLDADSAELLRHLPRRTEIYASFRRFMLGFERREYRSDKCSMAALLALCMSRDVRLASGETVMDWHRAGITAGAHTKMCDAVAAIVTKNENIAWDTLLPDHTIPATVDVFPDGTTKTVPAVALTRTWSRQQADEIWAAMSNRADAAADPGE